MTQTTLPSEVEKRFDVMLDNRLGKGFIRRDIKQFIAHELHLKDLEKAEAVREAREEIKKTLSPGLKDLLPILDVVRAWEKLHTEMGGEVVYQEIGIDGGYPRLRPIRVIYHSPLKSFQSLSQPEGVAPQKGE